MPKLIMSCNIKYDKYFRKDADIEDSIRQQFSKESHLRDEDEEMLKSY